MAQPQPPPFQDPTAASATSTAATGAATGAAAGAVSPTSSPSPRRSSLPVPLRLNPVFSESNSSRSQPLTSPTPTSPASPSSVASIAASSHRSRQEYLDSLQPPSAAEFERLARVQEQREKEHRRRDHRLRRLSRTSAREVMEARAEFAQANAAGDTPSRHSIHSIHSILGHSGSHSTSRSRSRGKGVATTVPDSERSAELDILRSKAATLIQRSYRGYRVRREMQGLGLDAGTRWTHAIRDAQWQEVNRPRARSETISSLPSSNTGDDGQPGASRSAARQNWIKVATIARRAGADEDSSHSRCSSPSTLNERDFDSLPHEQQQKRLKAQEKRRKHARVMGLQYFLEMVDLKHRYGSNLRTYHEEWKRSETTENFFYWLDYGEGRTLDLMTCPRERLDRERVRYLSREERQYYLVNVDPQGRLVWAKNGIRIDTTEAWKDSIHGIVAMDDPTPAFSPDIETHVQSKPTLSTSPEPHHHSSSGSHSASSRESRLEAAMAAKYATGFDEAKGVKKIRHVSAATIFNKLLRKSVRKNTWIFVADTSFRLYVGIKSSGAFQHSSFLHGARISAAGLIKVRNGRLASLSPLSGHYRPPASNFRAFVHSLEDAGVDMSRVSISRSYAVLVGLEAYVKTKAKGKEAVRRLSHRKTKLLDPEEAARREEAHRDKSQSAAREREVLRKERESEERARTETTPHERFLRWLGLGSRGPETQNQPPGDNAPGGSAANKTMHRQNDGE